MNVPWPLRISYTKGNLTEIHLQPNKIRKNKILYSGLVS